MLTKMALNDRDNVVWDEEQEAEARKTTLEQLQHSLSKEKQGQCLHKSGVALTFEELRIANAQHGKNCVSSPAAKTAISTD